MGSQYTGQRELDRSNSNTLHHCWVLRVSFDHDPTAKGPVYYVLKRRIPCNQEWLGRIDQYYQDPTACFTPVRALELTGLSEVIVSEESDFHIIVSATKDETLNSRFSRLLGFENSVVEEENMGSKTSAKKKKSFRNYRKVFESGL